MFLGGEENFLKKLFFPEPHLSKTLKLGAIFLPQYLRSTVERTMFALHYERLLLEERLPTESGGEV